MLRNEEYKQSDETTEQIKEAQIRRPEKDEDGIE